MITRKLHKLVSQYSPLTPLGANHMSTNISSKSKQMTMIFTMKYWVYKQILVTYQTRISSLGPVRRDTYFPKLHLPSGFVPFAPFPSKILRREVCFHSRIQQGLVLAVEGELVAAFWRKNSASKRAEDLFCEPCFCPTRSVACPSCLGLQVKSWWQNVCSSLLAVARSRNISLLKLSVGIFRFF